MLLEFTRNSSDNPEISGILGTSDLFVTSILELVIREVLKKEERQ